MSKTTLDSIDSLINRQVVVDSGNVIICLGIFVMLPAGFGYFGAVRESRILLSLVRVKLIHASFKISFLLFLSVYSSNLFLVLFQPLFIPSSYFLWCLLSSLFDDG